MIQQSDVDSLLVVDFFSCTNIFTYMQLHNPIIQRDAQICQQERRNSDSCMCLVPRSGSRPKMSAVLIGCAASVLQAPLSLGLTGKRVTASLTVDQRTPVSVSVSRVCVCRYSPLPYFHEAARLLQRHIFITQKKVSISVDIL